MLYDVWWNTSTFAFTQQLLQLHVNTALQPQHTGHSSMTVWSAVSRNPAVNNDWKLQSAYMYFTRLVLGAHYACTVCTFFYVLVGHKQKKAKINTTYYCRWRRCCSQPRGRSVAVARGLAPAVQRPASCWCRSRWRDVYQVDHLARCNWYKSHYDNQELSTMLRVDLTHVANIVLCQSLTTAANEFQTIGQQIVVT